MKHASQLLLSLIASVSSSLTAAAQPAVGDPPPPIGLEDALQAPADAPLSWDKLQGKVVMLEFWATWCGPCVAAFPHINTLAEEFKDEPVVFLSITDEPRSKVEPFLALRGLKTWVGLDTDKSMMKEYAIRAIPHTVLVGKDGKVAAITSPGSVTPEVIRALLAGKPAELSAPRQLGGLFVVAGEIPGVHPDPQHGMATLRLIIQPALTDFGMTASNDSGVTAEAWTLREAIAAAMDVPAALVEPAQDLPAGLYMFVVRTPGPAGQWRRLLRLGIEERFGLTIAPQALERDVLVLRRMSDELRGISTGDPEAGMSLSTSQTGISATSATITPLARWLGEQRKMHVIDQTGLTDVYDYELTIDRVESGAIDRALERDLNLRLERERRPIEIIRVAPAPPSAP